MSCGGCHQNVAFGGIAISPDVNWPASGFFVHVNEGGTLSNALTTSFLPVRAAMLNDTICNPPAPIVPVSFEDFENGFVNWESLGQDVLLNTSGLRVISGTNSADLQDNSGSASTLRQLSFDASNFEELEINFWFKTVSFEAGEEFSLDFRSGGTWQNVKTFVVGEDFEDRDEMQEETFVIDASIFNFGTNAQFRFRCNASGNGDDVYIDDIQVLAR